MTSKATVPSHVPLDRIVDVDIYALEGADDDFLLAWVRLRDSQKHDIVWSPRNGGHWIAMRGLEIDAIYRDSQTYSSRAVLVPRRVADAYRLKPTNLDPPEHRDYRRVLSRALSSLPAKTTESVVREVMRELLAVVRPKGRCDVVREFTGQLPLIVFFRLAALPLPDSNVLPHYAEPILVKDDGVSDTHVMGRYADFLRPFCRERMLHPGNDLLSRIVCGEIDGVPMSEEDAVEMATTVLTGGIDTVCSTLCLIMIFLAENPAFCGELSEGEGALERALPELLRRFPIMTKGRLVTRDHQINDVIMRDGDMVILPPLHGLDDRIFSDPLAIDFQRTHKTSLTFGSGPHRCPGASLAALEIKLAIETWLHWIPRFALCPKTKLKMQGGVLGAVRDLTLVWDETTELSGP